MDILILYRRKYGMTRQYAEWIHEVVDSEMMALEDADRAVLDRYETIIFGTVTRSGKVKDMGFLLEHWDVLRTKNVMVYAVSASSPGEPVIHELYDLSLPQQVTDRLFYLPLPGRLNVKELDLSDKAAHWLNQLISHFAKKQKGFAFTAEKCHPPVKPEYIAPLIDKVNELKNGRKDEFAGSH
ncbi:flavodoxin domain-containing protein [Bacillus marinisedimentorum]|uniref:flavodoxin domain-containing protein n=1 Tax=Bacillus marinisedimentorum TaxID=1821260 RepID=UPI0008722E17|nr:flavodoxin domain-containing protein [Bacillus marinisedimentorum]